MASWTMEGDQSWWRDDEIQLGEREGESCGRLMSRALYKVTSAELCVQLDRRASEVREGSAISTLNL